jgi:serine O-acetyltransferase
MRREGVSPNGLSAVRADVSHYFDVHEARSVAQKANVLCQSRGLWALMLYRLGRSVRGRPSAGARLGRILYAVGYQLMYRITRVYLPLDAELGERVWLGSHGPIIVSPLAKVGPGCSLHGGTTLGLAGRGEKRGAPRLEANVTVCPGASIIGPIAVPTGVVVGPNSVVTRKVEGSSTWLGVPARAATRPPRFLPSRRLTQVPLLRSTNES